MKKFSVLPLCLLVAALGLTACGGSTEQKEPTAGQTVSSEEQDTDTDLTVSSEEQDADAKQPAGSEAQDTDGEDEVFVGEPLKVSHGERGEGPAVLDLKMMTLTVPKEFNYTVDNLEVEDDDRTGFVEVWFHDIDLYLEASTSDTIHSLDEAAQATIDLRIENEVTSEITGEITCGDLTFKTVHITTSFSDDTFLVYFYERADGVGVFLTLLVDNEVFKYDDPAICSLVGSIRITE